MSRHGHESLGSGKAKVLAIGASIAALYSGISAYNYGIVDPTPDTHPRWTLDALKSAPDDTTLEGVIKPLGRILTWQQPLYGVREPVSNGAVAAFELAGAAILLSCTKRNPDARYRPNRSTGPAAGQSGSSHSNYDSFNQAIIFPGGIYDFGSPSSGNDHNPTSGDGGGSSGGDSSSAGY